MSQPQIVTNQVNRSFRVISNPHPIIALAPPPPERKPFSLDLGEPVNGMMLVDACLPQAVVRSLCLLLEHGYIIETDVGGSLVLRKA